MRRALDVESVRAALEDHGLDGVTLAPVGGGDISAAYRAEGSDGRLLFIKHGRADVLSAEEAGLTQLHAARHSLVVPKPVALLAVHENEAVLVLEWLERASADVAHWTRLGRGLAELHRTVGEEYGYDRDNFIGRLPQSNAASDNWVDFFRERRLEPQAERARRSGRWSSRRQQSLDRLYGVLPEILPPRPEASLVHGDLWGGNAMATTSGPAIVDPAVYHGHREVDIAMTELFGGFSSTFYDTYRDAYPVDSGYEQRRDVYNLYHLLNHLNHFGGSYAGSVDRVLDPFGR